MSTCWPSDVCTGHQRKATIEFVVLCISPDDPSSSLWVQHAGKRRSFRRLLVLESVCGEDTFAGKVDVGIGSTIYIDVSLYLPVSTLDLSGD